MRLKKPTYVNPDIYRILNDINRMIKANEEEIISNQNIYLHTGSAGVLLYAILYNEILDDSFFDELPLGIINQIMDIVSGRDGVSPSFCEGLSGIGWLLIFLKEIDYVDFDTDDFLADTDLYLNSFLDVFIQESKWDTLYGYIGIGFYFLKRMNRQSLEKIVFALNRTIVTQSTGMAWERFEPYFSKNIIDMGLAHGNSGIIVFLSECYKNGILRDTCRKLISNVLNFYLSQRQDFYNIGSFWKDFIPAHDGYRENDEPKFSKLAWCYGDLTILNALHQAAVTLSDHQNSNLLKAMAIETSKRRDFDDSLVKDAFCCHGSSGIMLLFQELYERTGEIAFQESAEYWLSVTLSAFGKQEKQLMALKDPFSEYKFELLEGISGIGCALLNRTQRKTIRNTGVQSWKEAFFLFNSLSVR
ncbi:lanthionine synthetase LanC family protein [Pedobacter sp. 22163]|uniref:lanthionine synthetase LanC family protein n=1 Tax=Pedobacter sp. 22163 TaxID=3453883 RepID=UPI003F87ED24